jgi:4-methylaminobutanoate oxidase (formaldehyde-forming)
METSWPSETGIVIVGGGVIGCSVAYHLAQLGCRDVVLLEQNTLAGGTTWHAAGLVGRLRTSNSMTRINKYSAELYASIAAETGHYVGWKQVGSLILGRSSERMQQLRRTAAMSEWFGVQVDMLRPRQALERWPLLRIDDILGAAWLPHDGKVIPKELTLALAKSARAHGVRILEQARVLELEHRHGRVVGVRTAHGSIAARNVVLCGGMWTRALALRCGVHLPLYPVEHHYVVSNPIPGAFDELPVGRDPDLCLYFRGEGDTVMLGAFQARSKAWTADPIPAAFSFQLLDPDWGTFAEPLAHGKHRIPRLESAGFAKFVNGPESFTPDNQFLMGETPELRGLFVCAGFNSVGIASAGGAGKYLAEWLLEGEPSMDLWAVDVRRFGAWANNRTFLRARVGEILGLHYQMAWPNREPETGRNLRRSALHDRLAAQGACFGVKAGWERPNWFAGPDAKPEIHYAFGRQNWFPQQALEHRACRERVALFDQSGFAKFLVRGPDATALLQRLCGANVDVPLRKLVYTGMFNRRGGFESDLTLVRTSATEYYAVTGTAQGARDMDWIRRHVQAGERAEIVDVTSACGVLGVMGPHARTLLSRLTPAALDSGNFPFATCQDIEIGSASARALRVTYVGELGWELHIAAEQMLAVYEALIEAGADLGLTNAGHYAINSLRLEKGYRAWGADLSPDDTPLEAGLGFALDWSKPFLGRDALLAQRKQPLHRRLVVFLLTDPEPTLWGSEPIYRNGVLVGYTTSGSYAHTLGTGIGMGYVRISEPTAPNWIETGAYEIGISGDRCPARPHLRAPYDPERKRILA